MIERRCCYDTDKTGIRFTQQFSELEKEVKSGQPIFLTKNGYGTMVLLSIEEYSKLTDQVERKLDEADIQAESTDIRLSHEEVFGDLRKKING